MQPFILKAEYSPAGDQPQAIEQLVNGLNTSPSAQTLLGVTGSGKTYTIANVIQKVQKPTLVLAHNKTLAAQLYNEFKTFFPENFEFTWSFLYRHMPSPTLSYVFDI